MSKIDRRAATVTVDEAGMFRIDDVALFRVAAWDGDLWVEIKDRNRARCGMRGDECVMVPLDLFVAKLVKTAQRMGG